MALLYLLYSLFQVSLSRGLAFYQRQCSEENGSIMMLIMPTYRGPFHDYILCFSNDMNIKIIFFYSSGLLPCLLAFQAIVSDCSLSVCQPHVLGRPRRQSADIAGPYWARRRDRRLPWFFSCDRLSDLSPCLRFAWGPNPSSGRLHRVQTRSHE